MLFADDWLEAYPTKGIAPLPSHIKDQILLLAVGSVLFFANLGVAPLWDRDEPRNAGCTAEMLERGEFVVPIFNDELRTHKPILLYWLMMVSYAVFGVSELGARAVSATVGLGTVLLTYHIARRLFDRRIARWAGVVLASTIMFSIASRAATPDGLLIFCGTLAIYLFVRGSFSKEEESCEAKDARLMPQGACLYGMYAAMGLGVLAKGPVGLVLPTAVIGMYLLIMRLPESTTTLSLGHRWWSILRPFAPLHFLRTCWHMRPLTALLTAGLVAVPWYVWVHFRTDGVWTQEFFWVHNVSRASATMEGHAGPPVLFYVATILVGFFPWSILAIPTSLQIIRDSKSERQRRAFVLLACWVGVYIGIFSLAQTKLPSYVTPCYPALAVMVGCFMARWSKQVRPLRMDASITVVGQVFNLSGQDEILSYDTTLHDAPVLKGWVKVGLAHWIVVGIALQVGLPLAANRWLPGSEWLGFIGAVPLLGGVACWYLLSCERYRAAQKSFVATAVAFVTLLMALVPAEIGRHRDDLSLFDQIHRHRGPVVAYGHLEPSWIFYGGKPIREFQADQCAELATFLAEHQAALLLTTDRRLQPLTQQVPIVDSYQVVHQTEYFLRNRELLLLKSAGTDAGVANRRPRTLDKEPRPY